jgi:hypothetical protein
VTDLGGELLLLSKIYCYRRTQRENWTLTSKKGFFRTRHVAGET